MSDNLLKNPNVMHFDPSQISNLTFDGKKDAVRVSLVDGLELNVENLTLPEFKFPEQKPIVTQEVKIEQVDKIVTVTETRIERIEVPVIVKEYEVITIEKPVMVTEVKVIEVEKPIIVKEIQVIETKISEVPMIAKVCMVIQALALIGILLTKAL